MRLKFQLIDQIVELEPGRRILCHKRLRAEEDYLRDHFPLFPIMPGVLMLEAVFQSSAWLLRASHEFSRSFVRLVEARNIKYSDFVEPGELLVVEAELQRDDGRQAAFKVQGRVAEGPAVSGRLILEQSNLADSDPSQAPLDAYIIRKLREEFDALRAG